jgi:uncharacterized delta-60 repeat protein
VRMRSCVIGLVSIALAAAASPAALAAPGQLDSSFSGNGKKKVRFTGGENYGQGVAIQPDGKIVVVGQVLRTSGLQPSKIALFRLNTNGTLDATFGGDGSVTTDFTHHDDAQAVVVQPNGKIVVAGRAGRRGGRFLLVRYRPNGRLDRTFSGDGKKFTNFTNGDDFASAVALQNNGKIVAAGVARAFTFGAAFAIARYNRDGSLDTSFSTNGRVRTKFTKKVDEARAVAIQSDGKIVAAGGAAIFSHTPESDFALARYRTDGTPDSSFDGDGKLTLSFGSDEEWADGVAIQGDGKIVAAGTAGPIDPFSEDSKFALARFETDGTPDAGFGNAGQVTTNFTANDFDGAWGGLAIQASGKIVAAGHAGFLRFALARYKTDGSLDTTFSSNGKAVTGFTCCLTIAKGIAIQANGKIVLAGDQGESESFAVARFLGG